MIVALEGIDGSGKSTQAVKLWSELNKRGIKTYGFSEPQKDGIGAQLRELALGQEFHEDVYIFLFLAARAQLLGENSELFNKAKTEHIILLDRYKASTFAYQMAWTNKWAREMGQLHRMIRSVGPDPDLTLYFDISPEESDRRKGSGLNHFDRWNRERKQALIDAYKMTMYPSGLYPLSSCSKTIDATGNEKAITDESLEIILKKYQKLGGKSA